MAVDGLSVGLIAAGALVGFAGIKGVSIPSAIQKAIQGQSPSSATLANQISGTALPPGENSSPNTPANPTGQIVASGSAQSILQQTAAQFGWGSGTEWQALQSVEMAEAGFDPSATNATTGAYGLAQALGHGTAATKCPATGVNEYGGYGLTTAQAQAANCGDAGSQALWMCNYIQSRYGTPTVAWAHEQSQGWY